MNRSKFLAILSVLLLLQLSTACNSSNEVDAPKSETTETKPPAEKEDKKDPILLILQNKQAMDKQLEEMETASYSFENDPPIIELKVYLQDKALRKVEYSAGGDHGVISETYYLGEKGELFFAEIAKGGWHFSGEAEGETIDFQNTYTFYYNQEQPVKASLKKVKAKTAQFEEAMAKAKEEDYDASKGQKLLARAKQLKELVEDNAIGADWEGLEYLELER